MSLKKIVQPQPQEAPPLVSNTLILDEPMSTKSSSSVKDLNFPELKSSSKFTDARHKIKTSVLLEEFQQKLNSDLELFNADENRYDIEFVLKVCNIAESYFIQYKKMGEIKQIAVIQVLLPYFKNDSELIKNIILHIYPKITKSNILRRNKTRIFNGIKSVIKFFLSK